MAPDRSYDMRTSRTLQCFFRDDDLIIVYYYPLLDDRGPKLLPYLYLRRGPKSFPATIGRRASLFSALREEPPEPVAARCEGRAGLVVPSWAEGMAA